MSDRLKWGILSTGRIAGDFAEALAQTDSGDLVAVGSRTKDSAEAFARRFGGVVAYGGYEGVLADAGVDAVYIATPHPMHAEWALRAAEAGKHILCEKPLTMTAAEAERVVAAARAHDVFLMEAFMYRCHPQTEMLVELVRNGAVGDLRLIQATFSFRAPFDARGRHFARELGGGGILDVGCYTLSMARLLAGAALGLGRSAEPLVLTGVGRMGPAGTDDVACACLRFGGDILAMLSCGVGVDQENQLLVYGSEGRLVVPVPWSPGKFGDTPHILIQRTGKPEERIDVPASKPLFALEADKVAAHIHDREAPWPAMTQEDTLGNMRALDRWLAEVGAKY